MMYAIVLLIMAVIVLIACVAYLINQVISMRKNIDSLSQQHEEHSTQWRRIFDPTYPY